MNNDYILLKPLPPTLLCLFFLTAAIIEVQVVGGDLQSAWNHCHNGDELAIFRQNQLFSLALVFSFHPEKVEVLHLVLPSRLLHI